MTTEPGGSSSKGPGDGRAHRMLHQIADQLGVTVDSFTRSAAAIIAEVDGLDECLRLYAAMPATQRPQLLAMMRSAVEVATLSGDKEGSATPAK